MIEIKIVINYPGLWKINYSWSLNYYTRISLLLLFFLHVLLFIFSNSIGSFPHFLHILKLWLLYQLCMLRKFCIKTLISIQLENAPINLCFMRWIIAKWGNFINFEYHPIFHFGHMSTKIRWGENFVSLLL